MNRRVLWDSSAILALLDADDGHHSAAVRALESLAAERRPSFVTNLIEAEAHALLLARLGRVAALEWLLGHGLERVRTTPHDETTAAALLARFTDKDWSLCDAVSFVVMERTRAAGAFTFDHHFRQYGRFRLYGP